MNPNLDLRPYLTYSKPMSYRASDLFYNIFCCLKCKTRSGKNNPRTSYERYEQFTAEANSLNDNRDLGKVLFLNVLIVTIVTTLNVMQYKMQMLETALLQRRQNKPSSASTNDPKAELKGSIVPAHDPIMAKQPAPYEPPKGASMTPEDYAKPVPTKDRDQARDNRVKPVAKEEVAPPQK